MFISFGPGARSALLFIIQSRSQAAPPSLWAIVSLRSTRSTHKHVPPVTLRWFGRWRSVHLPKAILGGRRCAGIGGGSDRRSDRGGRGRRLPRPAGGSLIERLLDFRFVQALALQEFDALSEWRGLDLMLALKDKSWDGDCDGDGYVRWASNVRWSRAPLQECVGGDTQDAPLGR